MDAARVENAEVNMKWSTLVTRELFQRKKRLITSGLAIILGIAVIVSINNIMTYSEYAVSQELDALGNNILILPQNTTLENYYNADLQGGELPEEYVTTLAMSNLEGLDNVSPKLSIPVEVGDKKVTLTGIMPKSEFAAKASWKGAGIFSRPKGCGNVEDVLGLVKKPAKETLVRKRVIENLEAHEVLCGADVAECLNVKEGDEIALLGKNFHVTAVLPQTGTIDDSRIFSHLHTVQQLSGKESIVNAIEVVGCCEQISKGLVAKISPLVPGAKVVTITQIIDTQINTNSMMKRLSQLFLVIIIVIGGATIANDMYGNVSDRRKEIGTLMAMGASSKMVQRIFLQKAVILGLIGGIGGYFIGTIAALFLGPIIAGIPVLPMPLLFPIAIVLSLAINITASYLPARSAAKLDPSIALQEV